MKFTKMHGCANDYVYFNCIDGEPENIPELARRVSDRHTGVGGDGIVLICSSKVADFKMRMFNADGTEGAMCGNAIRCVAKYVYDRGFTDKTKLIIETKSGNRDLELFAVNGLVSSVRVNMGEPVINKTDGVLSALGGSYQYTDISMGNPHCVIFTSGVEDMVIDKTGSEIENNTELFPDRTNVEFVEYIGENTLRMRVWERGSGETMACGTGACAVAVSAVLKGICDIETPVIVKLNGGKLQIEVENQVYMTGPAEFVFDGELEY